MNRIQNVNVNTRYNVDRSYVSNAINCHPNFKGGASDTIKIAKQTTKHKGVFSILVSSIIGFKGYNRIRALLKGITYQSSLSQGADVSKNVSVGIDEAIKNSEYERYRQVYNLKQTLAKLQKQHSKLTIIDINEADAESKTKIQQAIIENKNRISQLQNKLEHEQNDVYHLVEKKEQYMNYIHNAAKNFQDDIKISYKRVKNSGQYVIKDKNGIESPLVDTYDIPIACKHTCLEHLGLNRISIENTMKRHDKLL